MSAPGRNESAEDGCQGPNLESTTGAHSKKTKDYPSARAWVSKARVENAMTCRIHGGSGLICGSPSPSSVGSKTQLLSSLVNLSKLIFFSKPQFLHL